MNTNNINNQNSKKLNLTVIAIARTILILYLGKYTQMRMKTTINKTLTILKI